MITHLTLADYLQKHYRRGAELGSYAFDRERIFFDRKLVYNLGFKKKVGGVL